MKPAADGNDTFAGQQNAHIMKKVVTVYGLIAGVIVSTIMGFSITLMQKEEGGHQAFQTNWMLVGYASMVLAFCFIFIATKNYRDKQLGGTISFGKAFLTGFWIALIASVCYTVTWIIIYKCFYPDFMDRMTNVELTKLQESGADRITKAAKRAELESMMSMYKTWPGLIGMTMAEILPVGILMALISALVFKRKNANTEQRAQLAS